jgi:hypothetical protein
MRSAVRRLTSSKAQVYSNPPVSENVLDSVLCTSDSESPSISRFLSYSFLVIASIGHRSRMLQMTYVAGNELKYGLIEEHYVHILLDVLFLTITLTPVYSGILPTEINQAAHKNALTMLYYFSASLSFMSIIAHSLLIFAYVEIPIAIFRSWFVKRIDAVLMANLIHMANLYVWLLCFACFPIATFPNIQLGAACTGVVVATIIALCLLLGTYSTPGAYDSLHYMLKNKVHPGKKHYQQLAEEDKELFLRTFQASSNEITLLSPDISLESILDEVNLSHLEPVFTSNNVTLAVLMKMEDDDFRELKITIGHRVIIREVLNKYRRFQ